MEATLCLRLPRTSTTINPHCLLTTLPRTPTTINPHCLLTTLPRNPTAIKPHCLLITRQRFRATPPAFHHRAFSSMSSNGRSIKSDFNRLHKLVSAYSVPPPPPRPISGNGRVRNVAIAGAGVVLACLIGVLCSNMKQGDHAHALWPFPSSSMSQSPTPQDKTPEKTEQEKSMDVLTEIFVSRYKFGNVNSPTLQSLLREKVGEAKLSKDYPKLLERSDEGRSVRRLKKEWEQKGSEEQYDLALLLIDVYLYQGDYQKAMDICEQMIIFERYSDFRYQLRKDILEKWFVLKGKSMEDKIIAEELLKLIEDRKQDGLLRPPTIED